MQNIFPTLLAVALKTLRKFAVFLGYSALVAAGVLSVSLSLMYFMDAWEETSWQSYWVAAGWESSIDLLFVVTPFRFLLFLIPQTRRSWVAKNTSGLSYILCVVFIGTSIAWVFLMKIGYEYHGWD